MTTQRDDLAREIFIADNSNQPREASINDWEWYETAGNYRGRVEGYQNMAAGMISAGWTKPRTITTMAELQKLGNGAVILDVDGDVSQRRAGQWCGYDTAPLSDRKVAMFLPATVLYEPTP